MAAREGRILLTFDKDFGELARGSVLPAACGVVLLRIPMPKPSEVGSRLAELITVRDDWAVISPSSSPAASGCDRLDSLQRVSVSQYSACGPFGGHADFADGASHRRALVAEIIRERGASRPVYPDCDH